MISTHVEYREQVRELMKQTHGYNRMLVTRAGKVAWEKMNWVKGVRYMLKEGNQALGDEHTVEYTDIEL